MSTGTRPASQIQKDAVSSLSMCPGDVPHFITDNAILLTNRCFNNSERNLVVKNTKIKINKNQLVTISEHVHSPHCGDMLCAAAKANPLYIDFNNQSYKLGIGE